MFDEYVQKRESAGEKITPESPAFRSTYQLGYAKVAPMNMSSVKINDKTYKLEKDDSAYVPANSKQFIKNTGTDDLRFLCIVEPAWKADDEILLE